MRRRAARGAAAVLPLLLLFAHASALGTLAPQAAPPPTPVPPNGSPSPFVSRLTVPPDPIPVPSVEASAAILVDLGAGQVLFGKAADRARPVASLTKIMTALVVLENEEGHLDRTIRVHPDAVFGRDDYGAGSTLGLRAGEGVSVRDLLAGLLLGSANDAAEALAIEEAGSVAFVRRMNARAKALGMTRTRFASPHGLDDRGRSSPADLVRARSARRCETARSDDLIGRRFAVVRSTSARPGGSRTATSCSGSTRAPPASRPDPPRAPASA